MHPEECTHACSPTDPPKGTTLSMGAVWSVVLLQTTIISKIISKITSRIISRIRQFWIQSVHSDLHSNGQSALGPSTTLELWPYLTPWGLGWSFYWADSLTTRPVLGWCLSQSHSIRSFRPNFDIVHGHSASSTSVGSSKIVHPGNRYTQCPKFNIYLLV